MDKDWEEKIKKAAGLGSIRECRWFLGVTHEEFAKIMSISESTLWKWESGTEKPSLDQAIRIKQLFALKDKPLDFKKAVRELELRTEDIAEIFGISVDEALKTETGWRPLCFKEKVIILKLLENKEKGEELREKAMREEERSVRNFLWPESEDE